MRFAIIGAGAIGAYIGACLARAGRDVTLFARGPHLRAMQERGIRVISASDQFEVKARAVGELDNVGISDVVILGVKAHALTDLAPRLGPILGPETVVISTQNGIPWWFFQVPGERLSNTTLDRVDPGGVIARSIEFSRVIGSIVYFSTEIAGPGVISHIEGNRLSLGEPGGTRSPRCRRIAEELIAVGLRCPITAHLRQEIWVKAMGSAAFNPISMLTGATLGQIVQDAESRELVRRVMAEVEAVASSLGFRIPISAEQRIEGAEKAGNHKTSMLQDFEAGRPLEIEALTGAVIELGDRLGIAMPHAHAVYSCAKLLSQGHAGRR